MASNKPSLAVDLLSLELTRSQHELLESTCSLDQAEFVVVEGNCPDVQLSVQNRVALARRWVEAARRAVRRLALARVN